MSAAATTISPTALLRALLAGAAPPVLDVREDADWRIDAPGLRLEHVPVERALARVDELASELPAGTVVVCARGINATRVAEALGAAGLSVSALEGGMHGWLGVLRAVPVETDVPGLVLRQVQRPGRGCLSYVLVAGGEALVVDPAPDAGFYLELADELGARVVTVVDTHLHADHLSGARELARSAPARMRLPRATVERGLTYAADVDAFDDGERLSIGDVELRALALPGHTTDMTGLVVAGRLLLAGDSLFADGLARPDLERGDAEDMRALARVLHATLHERLLPLGDDVVLLPGHDHPVVRAGPVAPTLAEVRGRVGELAIEDANAFATAVLADLPPRPENYEQVIEVNAGRRPPDPDLESGGNACATR